MTLSGGGSLHRKNNQWRSPSGVVAALRQIFTSTRGTFQGDLVCNGCLDVAATQHLQRASSCLRLRHWGVAALRAKVCHCKGHFWGVTQYAIEEKWAGWTWQ